MVSKKTRIIETLIPIVWFVFLTVCVLFPLDPFRIKAPLLLAFLLMNITLILKSKMNISAILIVLISVVYPIICAIQSLLMGSEFSSIISSVSTPLIILCVIPIVARKIQLKNFLYILLQIECLIIVAIAVLDFLNVIEINGSLLQSALLRFGMGGIIKLNNSISTYKLFLLTSPMLVFLLDYEMKKKSVIWIILVSLALFLTGTRANWLALAIYFVYSIFLGKDLNNKRLMKPLTKVVLLVVFAGVLIILIPSLFKSIAGNSFSISSDNTKLAQIEWFFKEFDDPNTLLFGKGFGVEVYDPARDIMVTEVEIISLYYLYEVGLFLFIPFAILIFYPFFSPRLAFNIKVAYLCYLISAFTNPILVSSTSYIVYLFIYYCILTNKKGMTVNNSIIIPSFRRKENELCHPALNNL